MRSRPSSTVGGTIKGVNAGGDKGGNSRYRRYLSSPRAQRRAFAIAIAIFVVGAAAFVFAFFRNTGHALPDVASDEPAKVATKQKTVPLDPASLKVARQFILSAVSRKDVDAAFDIVGPDLRGTLTRQQWDTGTIPVIYFPARDVPLNAFRVSYSYPDEALLRVSLIPANGKTSENMKGFTFFIGVKKVGTGSAAHWVVNYWAPDYHPPIPGGPQ